MSSNFSSAMVAVMMIVLAGCSKQPPKCSDEATFDLVRSIILGQIGGIEGASAKEIAQNMKMLLPRASTFEKEIKKYSCEAKLEVGGQYELPITYASQLDDAGEHLVLVNGIGRGDLQMIQLGMVTGIKNGRPVTVPAPAPAPAPAVTPTPAAPEPAAPAAADLMSLVGKSPFDAIKTPLLLEPVKNLLGNQYDAFKERLDVSSGVEQDGAWLIGAGGCRTHSPSKKRYLPSITKREHCLPSS